MSLDGNGDRASFTCLFTSAGILHGLHSDEALAALRPGQQSLLLPAAAWRRTLPTKPAIHLTASAQIPNDHAGEEPNGHGRHAVYSAAGTSTHARAPCLKHGCMVARVTCSAPRRSSCTCGCVPAPQRLSQSPFNPVLRLKSLLDIVFSSHTLTSGDVTLLSYSVHTGGAHACVHA